MSVSETGAIRTEVGIKLPCGCVLTMANNLEPGVRSMADEDLDHNLMEFMNASRDMFGYWFKIQRAKHQCPEERDDAP